MSRVLLRWGVPAAVVLGSLGVVGWPAWADHGGQQATNDLGRAKEMAALIEQGQLNLRDATTIAEKHVQGTALEVTCEIKRTEPQPRSGLSPPVEPDGFKGPATPKVLPVEKRLVYEVSCFAKDKLQTIHVDGLSKKVLGLPEPK